MVKEITVLSGKGGTGKTSLTAALAVLTKRTVFTDCDVDAPDLQMLLKPEVLEKQEFKEYWCPACKKMTIFVSTLDPAGYWVCTHGNCFGYRTSKPIKANPIPLKPKPYTYYHMIKNIQTEFVKGL